VIIPTFNRAHLLPRAIQSVLVQEHAALELIIVDDGSTDSTEEVVASYRATDPRIRYIRQENSGAPVARNRGVAEALGEWVAFQDSDDEWAPGFLAAVLPHAHPDRIVFTSHTVVYRSGIVELVPAEHLSAPKQALLRRNVISTQTALLPHAVALRFPFDESLARFQDWDLWLRLLAIGADFFHVPVSGATLYRQSDSISEGTSLARRTSLQRILRKQGRILASDPIALIRILARAYAPDRVVSVRQRGRAAPE
jgi:glycosyltransferase involved in cell wall biosynthesis